MDARHKTADPRRYPIDWVFCSRRCQDAFHKFYGAWKSGQDDGEIAMVDATPLEQAAMRMCLRFFGEAAGAIGFDKPLGAFQAISHDLADASTAVDGGRILADTTVENALELLREIPPPKDQVHFVIDDDDDEDDEELI